MKTKKLLLTAAISTLLLTGCGIKNKDAIIVVNNEPITQAQFDEAFNTLTNNKLDLNDKENPLYLIMKDRVVNELVVKKLLEQEVEKRKITVTKEEEEEVLINLINRYGSKVKLQKILKQSGISNEKFKKDLNSQLKMRKLISMLGKVEVSDKDVENFYKENPDKYKTPEKVRASHILISANPKEIEKYISSIEKNKNLSKEELQKEIQKEINIQKAKAQNLLAEVKKDPKNFERYAREKSEDIASGQKGGDLGFFAYQDMVEPFSKVAFTLKPNKVSDLVQTNYGFHIIMVKDRKKAGNISFEKVKDDIKQYLLIDKQVKLLEQLITNLKNNAKIEFVNEEYKPQKIQEILKDEIKK